MAARTAAVERRHRDDLVRRVGRAGDIADLFARVSPQLRRLVPFDAAAWLMTDPGTGLPTGPTLLDNFEGISAEACSRHWRQEFLEHDINHFRDLIAAVTPVGGLRVAAGDPERSRRFRTWIRPMGFGDELRAVLRAGGTPWGTMTLWRHAGQPPFDRGDVALVASLSDPIGEALRVRARAEDAGDRPAPPGDPGILIFDGDDGELRSVNDAAMMWLDELPPDQCLPTGLGVAVPMWLIITMFQAAAAASGRGDGTARARVRSRRGRWLVCHATLLHADDASAATVAVVIEPASAADIAPLIAHAYDLTDREQQVTGLIARGAGTRQIADELFLSTHTVRDHVKAIFAKVGVSSRGELVAKLFAEHYEPGYLNGAVRTA